RAVAVDSAGESAVSAISTGLVANLPLAQPVACLSDPGRSLRGTVELGAIGAPSDGETVASVELEESPAGKDAWTTIATTVDPPHAAELDPTTLPDGPIELRARITDAEGSAATSSVRAATVANTAPAVALLDPGFVLSGSSATIAASATAAPGRTITFVR